MGQYAGIRTAAAQTIAIICVFFEQCAIQPDTTTAASEIRVPPTIGDEIEAPLDKLFNSKITKYENSILMETRLQYIKFETVIIQCYIPIVSSTNYSQYS